MEKTHGLSKTKIYYIWNGMRQRCTNPKSKAYKNYGGRGVNVCDDWMNDFKSFYSWAISNGFDESLQIDRIDNNGNYEPSNCRFVTRSENHINRRKKKFYNIYKRKNCSTYQIRIFRRPKIYTFSARTLDEAVKVRDSFIKKLENPSK